MPKSTGKRSTRTPSSRSEDEWTIEVAILVDRTRTKWSKFPTANVALVDCPGNGCSHQTNSWKGGENGRFIGKCSHCIYKMNVASGQIERNKASAIASTKRSKERAEKGEAPPEVKTPKCFVGKPTLDIWINDTDQGEEVVVEGDEQDGDEIFFSYNPKVAPPKFIPGTETPFSDDPTVIETHRRIKLAHKINNAERKFTTPKAFNCHSRKNGKVIGCGKAMDWTIGDGVQKPMVENGRLRVRYDFRSMALCRACRAERKVEKKARKLKAARKAARDAGEILDDISDWADSSDDDDDAYVEYDDLNNNQRSRTFYDSPLGHVYSISKAFSASNHRIEIKNKMVSKDLFINNAGARYSADKRFFNFFLAIGLNGGTGTGRQLRNASWNLNDKQKTDRALAALQNLKDPRTGRSLELFGNYSSVAHLSLDRSLPNLTSYVDDNQVMVVRSWGDNKMLSNLPSATRDILIQMVTNPNIPAAEISLKMQESKDFHDFDLIEEAHDLGWSYDAAESDWELRMKKNYGGQAHRAPLDGPGGIIARREGLLEDRRAWDESGRENHSLIAKEFWCWAGNLCAITGHSPNNELGLVLSIDRIIDSEPYSEDNCLVMLIHVNFFKSTLLAFRNRGNFDEFVIDHDLEDYQIEHGFKATAVYIIQKELIGGFCKSFFPLLNLCPK